MLSADMQSELIIFGMKNITKLLIIEVNGVVLALHKLWYLFCDDLLSGGFVILNKDDNDEVYIGLGFKKTEHKPYLFTWGSNISRTDLEERSQYLYLGRMA